MFWFSLVFYVSFGVSSLYVYVETLFSVKVAELPHFGKGLLTFVYM